MPGDDDFPSLTLVSVIPEVAYDVVARMLPGAILLALGINSYGCFQGWMQQKPILWTELRTETPIFGLIFLGAIACWILGLLLTAFGEMIWRGKPRREAFLRAVEGHRAIFFRAETLGIIEQKYKAALWQQETGMHLRSQRLEVSADVYQQLHEYLKNRRPEWRGLLSKTQAEVTFYANALAASLLVLAGTIFLTILAFYADQLPWTRLWQRGAIGYWTTALLPPALFALASWRGLIDKLPRLWSRHIALLISDLRQTGPRILRGLRKTRRHAPGSPSPFV